MISSVLTDYLLTFAIEHKQHVEEEIGEKLKTHTITHKADVKVLCRLVF
jgi:hypothetical protein